jgi:hypothetical protein
MHVMQAYLVCPDAGFLMMIKLQKLKAESDPQLLTFPLLTITAQKAYQTHVQKGTYSAPSIHKTRILALAAKIGGSSLHERTLCDDPKCGFNQQAYQYQQPPLTTS